jgi:hypothetical protein
VDAAASAELPLGAAAAAAAAPPPERHWCQLCIVGSVCSTCSMQLRTDRTGLDWTGLD